MNNPIAQNQEQPISEQRFVLYARKSTEDEGSQVNSIEDQIKSVRNMREAGVVIDMVTPDVGLIKTLVFPTVEFNNDSGGRLTLAMLFSLATQYSEHLSEQVKRGVDSGLAKGRSSGTNNKEEQKEKDNLH